MAAEMVHEPERGPVIRTGLRGHHVVCAGCRSSASCGQQPAETGEIVGGYCQDDAGSRPLNVPVHSLCHPTDRFSPAEGLLDLFAMLLGQGIARMPSQFSVTINSLAHIGDILERITALAQTQRKPPG